MAEKAKKRQLHPDFMFVYIVILLILCWTWAEHEFQIHNINNIITSASVC